MQNVQNPCEGKRGRSCVFAEIRVWRLTLYVKYGIIKFSVNLKRKKKEKEF